MPWAGATQHRPMAAREGHVFPAKSSGISNPVRRVVPRRWCAQVEAELDPPGRLMAVGTPQPWSLIGLAISRLHPHLSGRKVFCDNCAHHGRYGVRGGPAMDREGQTTTTRTPLVEQLGRVGLWTRQLDIQ